MNIKLGNNIATWNIVLSFGMILVVCLILFDWLVPKPSAAVVEAKYEAEFQELEASLKLNEKKLQDVQEALTTYSYKGDPESVTPQILALVNSIAKNKNITVKSFRPQKPDNVENLTRLKYVVLVEGSFRDVVSFVKAADEPTNLFSVSAFQAASADGESDKVNATISLVAFALQTQNPGASTRG